MSTTTQERGRARPDRARPAQCARAREGLASPVGLAERAGEDTPALLVDVSCAGRRGGRSRPRRTRNGSSALDRRRGGGPACAGRWAVRQGRPRASAEPATTGALAPVNGGGHDGPTTRQAPESYRASSTLNHRTEGKQQALVSHSVSGSEGDRREHAHAARQKAGDRQ
jgi:hypothetical protein